MKPEPAAKRHISVLFASPILGRRQPAVAVGGVAVQISLEKRLFRIKKLHGESSFQLVDVHN